MLIYIALPFSSAQPGKMLVHRFWLNMTHACTGGINRSPGATDKA